VLTFQSVVDFTVSTRAIITALYANLPANGSELVLFDFNRSAKLGLLIRPGTNALLARILPAPPRNYRTTLITNASPASEEVVERVTEAGEVTVRVRELDLRYPLGVYSLSHLALTFPVSDPLYGCSRTTARISASTSHAGDARRAGHADREPDSLTRIASNPFFPYLLQRIEQGTGVAQQHDAAAPVAPVSAAANP